MLIKIYFLSVLTKIAEYTEIFLIVQIAFQFGFDSFDSFPHSLIFIFTVQC